MGLIQSPTQLIKREVFPRINRLGREADHSPPPNAEVKNTWSYTSIPPHDFMRVHGQGYWNLKKMREISKKADSIREKPLSQ